MNDSNDVASTTISMVGNGATTNGEASTVSCNMNPCPGSGICSICTPQRRTSSACPHCIPRCPHGYPADGFAPAIPFPQVWISPWPWQPAWPSMWPTVTIYGGGHFQ